MGKLKTAGIDAPVAQVVETPAAGTLVEMEVMDMESESGPGEQIDGQGLEPVAAPVVASPAYVKAEGGPRNGSLLPYVDQVFIHEHTGGELAADVIRAGQVVGVYSREDLAHGPLMRWHGWQPYAPLPAEEVAE